MVLNLEFNNDSDLELIYVMESVNCVSCQKKISSLFHKCEKLYNYPNGFLISNRKKITQLHKEIVLLNVSTYYDLIHYTSTPKKPLNYYESLNAGFFIYESDANTDEEDTESEDMDENDFEDLDSDN